MTGGEPRPPGRPGPRRAVGTPPGRLGPRDLPDVGVPVPREEGPLFCEPWQASVFAMTVHLAERGVLAWPRFAAALGARLADEPDYHRAWASALVDVLAADGVLTPAQVETRERRWHAAAAATPHGQPITLPPRDVDA